METTSTWLHYITVSSASNLYLVNSVTERRTELQQKSMKAQLDLPLFLTSLRVAAFYIASHTDHCEGVNASQAKEKCEETINLKNKAVQSVLLLQSA